MARKILDSRSAAQLSTNRDDGDNPRRYKVAVFGSTGRGNYGHQVDTAWIDHPRAEVIAVCDANKAALLKAAKRLQLSGEQCFSSYEKMLDQTKPDVVAICPRWIDQHFDVAMAAAERSCHIYIEKPFCRTPIEADKIIQACEMRHLKLAIAHPTRHSPVTKAVQKLIQEGAIGNVLDFRTRGKEDRRGGGEDLWVLGSHMFDLLLGLNGSPTSCFAQVNQGGQPIRREHINEGNEGLGPIAGDDISATFVFDEGPKASFQSVRHQAGRPSRYGMQVFGSEGIIEVLEGPMPDAFILQDSSWSPGRTGKEWQRVSSAGIGMEEPLTDAKYHSRHHLAIDDFFQAIEDDRQPLCGMYDGRKVVEMTMAVFESQRTGQPVTFPLATREHPLDSLM